jgi:predicted enzyme related to lactoylglutathione lyase
MKLALVPDLLPPYAHVMECPVSDGTHVNNSIRGTRGAVMSEIATLTKVANVIIPAADQERMLRFYTETLGLTTRADLPFGGGSRWIEVAPPGTETAIAICPPGPGVVAGGKDTGISLQSTDVDTCHAQLKNRGVDVDAEVSRFGDAVPPMFWFRDPEGNTLMVVQGA